MSKPYKYWIVVASKDHVMRGVSGGFMQANHGKQPPLKRIRSADWVVFYSPKQTLEGGDKLQAFTAIGQVNGNDIYQCEVSDTFMPFRRNVTFHECQEVPIGSLIDKLEFIKNKKSWGYTFRFGLLEIGEQDFELIRTLLIAF